MAKMVTLSKEYGAGITCHSFNADQSSKHYELLHVISLFCFLFCALVLFEFRCCWMALIIKIFIMKNIFYSTLEKKLLFAQITTSFISMLRMLLVILLWSIVLLRYPYLQICIFVVSRLFPSFVFLYILDSYVTQNNVCHYSMIW